MSSFSITSLPPTPGNSQLARNERRRYYPKVGNKLISNVGAAAKGQWFLPWVDSLTGETSEMKRVYRRMLKHPVVKSALYTKVLAVAALPVQVHPAEGNSPRDREAMKFIEHNKDRLPEGIVGATTSLLQHLLIDGWQVADRVLGVETKGRYEGKIVLEGIKPKDPEDIRITADEFLNVTGFQDVHQPDRFFDKRDFIYSRYLPLYDSPTGQSDFRAAYAPYWMSDTVRKLRIIGQEKNTAGVLVGEYPDDGGDSQSALEEALENIRASTWMSIPEGTRVYALDIALGQDASYKSFLDDQDRQILIAIVGAYLQTLEGQISDGRGDTKVSKSIVELFQWLLAVHVEEIWNRQIIPDLIDWNYPGCGYPKITLGGVNEKDLQDRLQTLQGANQLVPLSRKSVYTDLSIQQPDPNDPDDFIPQSGQQPQQPPGMPGMGGMPGMSGVQSGSPFQFSERHREPELTWVDFREVGFTYQEFSGWDSWQQIQGGKWKSPGGRVLTDLVFQRMKTAAAKKSSTNAASNKSTPGGQNQSSTQKLKAASVAKVAQIQQMIAGGQQLGAGDILDFSQALPQLTIAELTQAKQALGIAAKGKLKADHVSALVNHAVAYQNQQSTGGTNNPTPTPTPTPPSPKKTKQQAKADVANVTQKLLSNGALTPAELSQFSTDLAQLTVAEIASVRTTLGGGKYTGKKASHVASLVRHAPNFEPINSRRRFIAKPDRS